MRCYHYQCTMSPAACVARRRIALSKKTTDGGRAGFGDVFCQKCEQGEKIQAELHPDEVDRYSAGIRRAKYDALEFKKKTGKLIVDVYADQGNGTDSQEKARPGIDSKLNIATPAKKAETTPDPPPKVVDPGIDPIEFLVEQLEYHKAVVRGIEAAINAIRDHYRMQP
jgi:hypothetical protein